MVPVELSWCLATPTQIGQYFLAVSTWYRYRYSYYFYLFFTFYVLLSTEMKMLNKYQHFFMPAGNWQKNITNIIFACLAVSLFGKTTKIRTSRFFYEFKK